MKKVQSQETWHSFNELFSTTYYSFDKIRYFCLNNKDFTQWTMIDIYLFYCKCSSIQETSTVFATNDFVCNGLWYWEKTLTKYFKALSELWFLERVVKRDKESNIIWHYVRVRFVSNQLKSDFESDRTSSQIAPDDPPNTIDIKQEILVDIKQEILTNNNTIEEISNTESTKNSSLLEDSIPKTSTYMGAAMGEAGERQSASGLYQQCQLILNILKDSLSPKALLADMKVALQIDTFDNIRNWCINYMSKVTDLKYKIWSKRFIKEETRKHYLVVEMETEFKKLLSSIERWWTTMWSEYLNEFWEPAQWWWIKPELQSYFLSQYKKHYWFDFIWTIYKIHTGKKTLIQQAWEEPPTIDLVPIQI